MFRFSIVLARIPLRLVGLLFWVLAAACDRRIVFDANAESRGGAGGAAAGGAANSGGRPGDSAVCGDGIPEGENEQCDEGGGTQSCTTACQFRKRVLDGIILYYTFQEGEGNRIFDRSGFGVPLNLTILDTGMTTWNAASLELTGPVLIPSDAPASKLVAAVQASSELSLEAWVEPANTTQDGPARILTVSKTRDTRNLLLGQTARRAIARARTTTTGDNGYPELESDDALQPKLTHLFFSRAHDGTEVLYVDAVERSRRTVAGDFSTWDTEFHLAIGAEFNEVLESRDFLGTMHLIAVYSRALTAAEVARNFKDGP